MAGVSATIDLGGMLSGMLGGGKGAGAAAGGAGLGGNIAGIASGMLKLVGIATGIAAGIALMVKSSGMLQSSLKAVGKMILLIVKPLGDVFGVALMPLIAILRPIGRFFNMIMRPWLLKAMAAMRAGNIFLREGEPGKAMGAFALGAEFLLKPFLDVIVKGVATGVGAVIDVIGIFGDLGDKIRMVGGAVTAFSTIVLEQQLGGVLAEASVLGKVGFGNLITSLNRTGDVTHFLIKGFVDTAAEMGTLDEYLKSDWKFVEIMTGKLDLLDDKATTVFDDAITRLEFVKKSSEIIGTLVGIGETWKEMQGG